MLAGMLIVLQQAAIAHPAVPPPPIAISPAPVITPAETLPRGPMPKNGPSGWIQTSDYPAMAVKNNRSGITRFMVSVDAKGRSPIAWWFQPAVQRRWTGQHAI
jgi:protein TonB